MRARRDPRDNASVWAVVQAVQLHGPARGVNLGFWPHLGCSVQNAVIFSRKVFFRVARISFDCFESLLLPQLLRGENDSRQSDEIQATFRVAREEI